MSPSKGASPRARIDCHQRMQCRLGTEFGRLLLPLVVDTPGAIAAVVSDDDGEALDFAHDPEEISALDVQLLAAQVGQSVLRLSRSALRHRLHQACVLLETPVQKLVTATVAGSFTLVLLLHHRANIAKALDRFSHTRISIERLLA